MCHSLLVIESCTPYGQPCVRFLSYSLYLNAQRTLYFTVTALLGGMLPRRHGIFGLRSDLTITTYSGVLSESLQLIPAPLRIYQQNSGTLSKNPELSWSEVKMVRRKMVRISVFHCSNDKSLNIRFIQTTMI